MVRPSKPRLMARVLDAVVNLDNTKGSSAREVLSFIRQSNVSGKNLTVQVHRALKHAVTAGLLRHRSGRYKVLATLNPISPANTNTVSNDQKTKEKKLKPDVRAPDSDMKSSRQKQERKKESTLQQRSNGRRSNTRRKSRRSPSTRRANTVVQNRKQRQRKRKHDEKIENLSSGRYILHGSDDESSIPLKRKTKRSRITEYELESDFSDESDHESRVNRKPISRVNKSLHRRQSRSKETRAKSRGRSTSRARTPQLLQRTMQARQHAIEEVGNDVSRYDEDHGSAERDVTHQETHEDVEGAREPNDSNSGTTLENS